MSRGVPNQQQEEAETHIVRKSSSQGTRIEGTRNKRVRGQLVVPAMPPCRDRRRESDTGLDAAEGGGYPSGGLL